MPYCDHYAIHVPCSLQPFPEFSYSALFPLATRVDGILNVNASTQTKLKSVIILLVIIIFSNEIHIEAIGG
jgi:hypothetical protein